MRVRSWVIGLLACAALLFSAPAQAAPISFGALLTTDQEIPTPDIPPEFLPFGVAAAQLDTDTDELSVIMAWAGLTSAPTGGHIHRYTTPSMVGPILIDLGPFPTWQTGAGFQTLSLTPVQTTSLLEGLADGSLYFNIHTDRNPAGEIRGNIGQVSVPVPEATSLLLLSTGLVAVGVLRRRRAAHR